MKSLTNTVQRHGIAGQKRLALDRPGSLCLRRKSGLRCSAKANIAIQFSNSPPTFSAATTRSYGYVAATVLLGTVTDAALRRDPLKRVDAGKTTENSYAIHHDPNIRPSGWALRIGGTLKEHRSAHAETNGNF
jgi:hypothetical protein